MLARLRRRGLRLAVISNWDLRLRPVLERLRLLRYFDVVVISQEVGFAKPDPAIFERASDLLEVPPEQILHVGDELPADVRGARAAGFQVLALPGWGRFRVPRLAKLTAWLNRHGLQRRV